MRKQMRKLQFTEFQERVYKEVKKIKKGQVKSYKEIAEKLKTSPRAVGQALKRNQDRKVPCHSVIKADGSLGGYNRGIKKKIKLLKAEGVKVKGGKVKQQKSFLRFLSIQI
jgi:O-6-methylguanine DNA methyltransferase